MDELLSKQEMKDVAIANLKQLGIYSPYVKGFKEKDRICFFEGFGGFWLDQEEEIYQAVKNFEEKYGHIVYAVTHEFTAFGELWDFLYVSKYREDSEFNGAYPEGNNRFTVYAYVWNKTDDTCSEFGSIEVQSRGGGIVRIG